MPQKLDSNSEDYIRFEDDEGKPIHVFVRSSVGPIPVRIDGVKVLDRSSERSRVSVDYQIDAEHDQCPDLEKVTHEETMRIMMVLKEHIPKIAQEILHDAAEEERKHNVAELPVESDAD